MGEKDITEKALESYNDVFADIINNLLFNGKKKVFERELEQGRERSFYSGEKIIREQERDTSKFWRNNDIRIAYFGLENETEPEDGMPFRIIGYDGAAYRDQISYEINEKGKRIKQITQYPVITLVLYFGYKKRWNKPKSLYDMFDKKMDKDLIPFINDYKINLFEIAYLTEQELEGFKSDFYFVADYFVQMRKTGTYIGSKTKVKHIREVLELLAVLSNDRRFWNIAEEAKEGDVIQTMSEALDKIEERGIKKGREQGEEKMVQLMNILLTSGRNEDAIRALNDAEIRQKFYAEFAIK